MFDGSIRPSRRTRGLPPTSKSRRSGKSSNNITNTSNREEALRAAKEGRERRAKINRERNAATVIQKITRGGSDRVRVKRWILDSLGHADSRFGNGLEGRGWLWGRFGLFVDPGSDEARRLNFSFASKASRNTIGYVVRVMAVHRLWNEIGVGCRYKGRVGGNAIEEAVKLGYEIVGGGEREGGAIKKEGGYNVGTFPYPEGKEVESWVVGLCCCLGGSLAFRLALEYEGLKDINRNSPGWGGLMSAIGVKESLWECDSLDGINVVDMTSRMVRNFVREARGGYGKGRCWGKVAEWMGVHGVTVYEDMEDGDNYGDDMEEEEDVDDDEVDAMDVEEKKLSDFPGVGEMQSEIERLERSRWKDVKVEVKAALEVIKQSDGAVENIIRAAASSSLLGRIALSFLTPFLYTRNSNGCPVTSMRAINFISFDGEVMEKLWAAGEEGRTAWCIAWEYGSRGRKDSEISGYVPRGVGVDGVVDTLGRKLQEIYFKTGIKGNLEGRFMVAAQKVWRDIWERSERSRNIVSDRRKFVWSDVRGTGVDKDGLRGEMETEDGGEYLGMFKNAKTGRILKDLPFSIAFKERYAMWCALVEQAKSITHAFSGVMDDGGFRAPSYVQIKVRREKLLEDSFEELWKLGGDLRKKLQVNFINEHGLEEAGIDGGGLFREYLEALIEEGFLKRGYFKGTDNETLLPKEMERGGGEVMEFLGRILGKAVYENVLVEPRFSRVFLKKMLGRSNAVEDMKFFDEEIERNMSKMRDLREEDFNNLGLTFEVSSRTDARGRYLGTKPQMVPLLPNGLDTPVTKANVLQYIYLLSHHKMNIELHQATIKFLKGFREIIPEKWIAMFSPEELQMVIGGEEGPINIPDLKAATVYGSGYHLSQPYIQDLWDILENECTEEEQRNFARFQTSVGRRPIRGWGSLEPRPAIQQVHVGEGGGGAGERLPTASTCMNLLKLPKYQDRKTLKMKLKQACNSGAGFELS